MSPRHDNEPKIIKLLFEVINNVGQRYSENKDYIEENMKKIYQREHITAEKVIYFVVFAEIMYTD